MKKVLPESEFKEKCLKKGIVYTPYLWNRYMDRCWEEIELELQVPLDK